MGIEIRGMAPLFQVFDMPTSVAFYRDVLGFEVRFMSSQFQANYYNQAGFWSWMDGAPDPIPTLAANSSSPFAFEALTITNGWFDAWGGELLGWTKSGKTNQNG